MCEEKEPTLDVEARAFTTPVTSYGDVDVDVGPSENNDDDGRMDASSAVIPVPLELVFDRERRSHHSAPIVHSLS